MSRQRPQLIYGLPLWLFGVLLWLAAMAFFIYRGWKATQGGR